MALYDSIINIQTNELLECVLKEVNQLQDNHRHMQPLYADMIFH